MVGEIGGVAVPFWAIRWGCDTVDKTREFATG